MQGMFNGRAQLAVSVDTTGQQVMQQSLLDLLQLGNDCLGLADGGVEDLNDLFLLVYRG
jgi:hypothetical protein